MTTLCAARRRKQNRFHSDERPKNKAAAEGRALDLNER
jgi:hypothetical protein